MRIVRVEAGVFDYNAAGRMIYGCFGVDYSPAPCRRGFAPDGCNKKEVPSWIYSAADRLIALTRDGAPVGSLYYRDLPTRF